MWQAYQCIEKQVFIPNIQGCIQYAYKSDSSVYDCGDCGKEIGEMYTFCMAMLPLVHNASATAAAAILAEAEISDSVQPSYANVRDALYPVLNDMGYKCSDIGVYSDDSSYSYDSVCDDDAVPDYWLVTRLCLLHLLSHLLSARPTVRLPGLYMCLRF